MHTTGEIGNSKSDRINNFDLIRLIAAAQVVLWHGIEHLGIPAPAALLSVLGVFPGVPIFFFVSGYLVTASFRRSRSVGTYFSNRALRIFPGLWVCFAFTFVSIAIVHGMKGASAPDLAKWIVPNIVGLSHTPAFLHDFGTGSVNGSLWTIPVELQFYLVLPFLVPLLARSGPRWIATFLVFLAISVAYVHLIRGTESKLIGNLTLRALPTWLYMFMLGMALEFRADWVRRFMVGRFVQWIVGYALWVVLLHSAGFSTIGNTASPLMMIPLAGVVISAAYTHRELADRLLGQHDVSYGIYLYHMPIINLLVATAPQMMNWSGLLFCAGLTGVAAGVSWIGVERPALRRKPRSPMRSQVRQAD